MQETVTNVEQCVCFGPRGSAFDLWNCDRSGLRITPAQDPPWLNHVRSPCEMLQVLTFAAGTIDALAELGPGGVFRVNMTGDTARHGIALAQWTGGTMARASNAPVLELFEPS